MIRLHVLQESRSPGFFEELRPWLCCGSPGFFRGAETLNMLSVTHILYGVRFTRSLGFFRHDGARTWGICDVCGTHISYHRYKTPPWRRQTPQELESTKLFFQSAFFVVIARRVLCSHMHWGGLSSIDYINTISSISCGGFLLLICVWQCLPWSYNTLI